MIWPLFRYIVLAALRDRFVYGLIGIVAIIGSLSVFFGSSAIVEQDNFTRSFAAFGFRLFGVAALVMFVVTYLRRCFENRDIDFLLSRPVGRTRFVMTHAAAFSVIAIFASLILGGTSVYFESGKIDAGVMLWWLSLTIEFLIMANVAMFFAFVMTSSTACLLVVFAFYLLCRLIGDLLGILDRKIDDGMSEIMTRAMEFISMFIPRLDLMAQSKWLLYGAPSDISFPFIFGQGAVFLTLIIAATAIDMRRRQF